MKRKKKDYDKELAEEFNHLEAVSRNLHAPTAPTGEFENIMAEMERRGIVPQIRKELKDGK
ncbi:hypothetical protein [Clostridium sp. E02]|uniref:hypothetical protein n=1 Tax=Clostridium sp. E02 TaxID=2487134 RepID=UPI000F53799D|nr:hypothetical protein [Clostridium sp. E02]